MTVSGFILKNFVIAFLPRNDKGCPCVSVAPSLADHTKFIVVSLKNP